MKHNTLSDNKSTLSTRILGSGGGGQHCITTVSAATVIGNMVGLLLQLQAINHTGCGHTGNTSMDAGPTTVAGNNGACSTAEQHTPVIHPQGILCH